MSEEEDSSSSSDLVSILKVRKDYSNTTAQKLPETQSVWGPVMIGVGVTLGVVVIAALFLLTGIGSKKTGAVRGNSGGSGRGVVEQGKSASSAPSATSKAAAARAAIHNDEGSAGGPTTNDGGGGDQGFPESAYDESPATNTTSGGTISVGFAGSKSTGAADKEQKPGSGKTGGSTLSSLTGRTSQKPPSVSTKTTKQLPERPLICVFGDHVDWKMRFPEDGLCDLAFYSALYASKANTFQSGKFDAGLRRVLAAMKTYKSTEPGIAVAATGIAKASKDISSTKGKATLQQLWSTGVHHYGVLDFVPSNKTKESEVKAMFVLLKELKKIQASRTPKSSNFKPYLAVGTAYFKDVNEKIYRSIEKALKDLKTELVVLRTHLDTGSDEVGTKKGCTITGSTVWERPVIKNHPSIKDTLDYVRKRKTSFDRSTRLAISVSLAGRWYKSLTGGKSRSAYVVGAKCQPLDPGIVTQLDSQITACTEETYEAHAAMDKLHEVMTTYDEIAGLAFIFENEMTLFSKVCKAQNAAKGMRPIGLAVFDTELDDWANACKNWNKFGSFTLTRAARKAVDASRAQNTTQRMECGKLPKGTLTGGSAGPSRRPLLYKQTR